MSEKAQAGKSGAARTVLLVDDHELVRAGLRRLIETELQVEVSEAGSSKVAYRRYRELRPCAAVLDLRMTGEGGLSLVERIMNFDPQGRLLILSMYDDAEFRTRARRAGALGFVSKRSSPDLLLKALSDVMSGTEYFDDDDDLALTVQAETPIERLTPREFEVFVLLAEGHKVTTIATQLNLSPKTVHNHRERVLDKLSADTTSALVRMAIRHGVISP